MVDQANKTKSHKRQSGYSGLCHGFTSQKSSVNQLYKKEATFLSPTETLI